MEKNKDIVFGIGMLAFGLVYFLLALQIPEFNDGNVSSDFLPEVYGVCVMVLSAIQVFQGFRERSGKETGEKKEAFIVKEVVITFILLIAYVALLKPIGFFLSSSLFLICLITLFTDPENRKKPKNIILTVLISVLFSAAVYLIFTRVFTLSLPAGILK